MVNAHVEIAKLVADFKKINERLGHVEAFQTASKNNQNKLVAFIKDLQKKMDTTTYTMHKLRVEQFCIKKNMKQMDHAISQIPYLMIDELHEMEIQKYFLILKDCTIEEGIGLRRRRDDPKLPDWAGFVSSIIKKFYPTFNPKSIAHCEQIQCNAWKQNKNRKGSG